MDYTIKEMNNSMTVFYYKSNGDIYGVATGIQDLIVYYGEYGTELSLILEQTVLPKDENFLNNIDKFKININTKSLEILPSLIQYPVANV